MQRTPRQRAALLAVAVFAYAAALPPLALWPLGWIALAPLFAAVCGLRPLRAFALGVAFEVGAGMLAASWLPSLLARYFALSFVASVPLAGIVYVASAGVQTGALCAWLAWASARGPVSPLLVGAAYWWSELARGATPIPFGLLASTQVGVPLLIQSAELIGGFGLGALIASANAALAGALAPPLRSARATLAIAAFGAASIGFGAWRLAGSDARAPAIAVAVMGTAQPAARLGAVDLVAVEEVAARTRAAGAAGARLVLWPELAVGAAPARDSAARVPLADASRAHDLDLAFGALGLTAEPRYTNAYYVVRAGVWADRYDKLRLLAPGETRGWGGRFEGDAGFAAGESPRPLSSRFARLGILLCSEAMFPASARARVAAGAELLVNPSNDVWFGTRAASEQQLAWVALRAVELRRSLLRPASVGVTAAIDPYGRITRLGAGDGALHVAAAIRSERTLYARLGDTPAGLALLALAFDAYRRRVKLVA